MEQLTLKRNPCSVCGLVSFGHNGWSLVVENRWLDHIKILNWHASLAARQEIKSACCRDHLKLLIVHWLEEASLRLLPYALNSAPPIAGSPSRRDLDLDQNSNGYLLGELSIHRETFSHVWTGSPAALDCILDALIPSAERNSNCAAKYPPNAPPPKSPHGLALH
jgi:hypothetical protein